MDTKRWDTRRWISTTPLSNAETRTDSDLMMATVTGTRSTVALLALRYRRVPRVYGLILQFPYRR